MNYEVIVGNVGTVYEGPDVQMATQYNLDYIAMSKANFGRVAGEPVTLFRDGELVSEYLGTNSNE